MQSNEIDKIIVDACCTLDHVINRLEQYPSQVVLVCDSERKLLGTVTDGDIRRSILAHKTLETPVVEIMNANPRHVTADSTKEEISDLMKKESISQVPILDNKGMVVGFETLRSLFEEKEKRSCPVVIMAGGFGKRLRPYTNDLPKPMVRLAGKPILERIINNLKNQGFKNLIITTHYLSSKIRDYFNSGEEFGVKITYLAEDNPLGTAGSLALVPEKYRSGPMLITNGDVVTDINYQQLLSFHLADKETQMTVCVKTHEYQVPFGVMSFEGGRVKDIVEKPIKRDFINAGIYIINPTVYSFVGDKEVLDMPDLVRRVISNEDKVSIFPIIKYWKDVGTIKDFSDAETLLEEEA